MTVKVVRGVVPNSFDNLSGSAAKQTPAQQETQAAQAVTQSIARSVVFTQSSDAAVSAVRNNLKTDRGSGSLKDIEKAEKLASDIKDEILRGDSKSAEESHSGLKSSNASYHLN